MVQQKSLLQKMEEAIGLIKILQQEKDEAAAKASAMENENREIKALLSLAESKADEMLAIRGPSLKEESRPKLGVTEPKEAPAAVAFKGPTREPDRAPVESAAGESGTVPSMDQRTPIPREPSAAEGGESPKKPSEDQTRSWAELRERFRRPLSTS